MLARTYTQDQLSAMYHKSAELDVDQGGHYDARIGAINVWSVPWTTIDAKRSSRLLGTMYARPADSGGYRRVEIEPERNCESEMALLVDALELASFVI